MNDVIETQKKPKPSPDLDALRQQYVPTKTCACCASYDDCEREKELCGLFKWHMGYDEFAQAGVELVQRAWQSFLVLGELAEWGWSHLGIGSMTKTDFALFCANSWGCSRSSVIKAWLLANLTIDLPEDVPPTLVYEIASGLREGDDLEKILNTAIMENWSTWDVREIKMLMKRGFITTWELPLMRIEKGSIVIYSDGQREVCAKLESGPGLIEAGKLLLQSRCRMKES